MTQEYYEKYYKNGELTDCYPASLDRVGFILTDRVSEDIEDVPVRLMVYLPKKNSIGGFGTILWKSGVGAAYLSIKDENWIVCNQAFMLNEVSSRTSWYPIPPQRKRTTSQRHHQYQWRCICLRYATKCV